MQCWAASNTHYAVLGSLQRTLHSYLHMIYHIYTNTHIYTIYTHDNNYQNYIV